MKIDGRKIVRMIRNNNFPQLPEGTHRVWPRLCYTDNGDEMTLTDGVPFTIQVGRRFREVVLEK